MFVRVVVQDTIKIQCYQLEKDKFAQFVSDVLHAKYANKVLPGQGLVILVQDYENVGSPYVYPGHGAVHISVKVGLLVFRPMVEQVVQGNIRYCDPSGILVSVGVFEDVFIAKDELPQPCYFNQVEGLWVWKYDDNDLYFELLEKVRFRVLGIEFAERNVQQKDNDDKKTSSNEQVLLEGLKPVMKITGSMREAGLGPIRWWGDEQEEDDEGNMNE